MNEENPVVVVLACNDNYAPFAGTTIESIIKHSSPDRAYEIYIFITSLKEENINKLESLSRGLIKIKCLDVHDYIAEQMTDFKVQETSYWSPETYYRFAIADVLPNHKKALYLDCDMIILKNIELLFDTDIGDCSLGAVYEVAQKSRLEYMRNTEGLHEDCYFNAGLLLIDIANFKKHRIKERAYDIIIESAKNNFLHECLDQDILNIVCYGNTYPIANNWNAIEVFGYPENLIEISEDRQKEIEDSLNNPYLYHYCTSVKPWFNLNAIYCNYFWDIVKDSIFEDEILKKFKCNQIESFYDNNYKVGKKYCYDVLKTT